MSGKKSRDKGMRREREFSKIIGGERVPLSGAAGGSYVGDVRGLDLLWEVKSRKQAWGQLYLWLDNVDALAIKADGKDWLTVMRVNKFLEGWNGMEGLK